MLKIETGFNNEILRAVSDTIKKQEMPAIVKLWKEMVKYIKEPKNKGVGLAAPQVGHNKRLIVVSLLRDWDDESFKTIMMINPEILEHSEEKNIDIEWCLSVPWEQWKVARWDMIKLKYTDDKGKTQTIVYDDLRSRIVQHEIDHLDGILYTDKLESE